MKCYQLPGSVTIDWGTFTTTNRSTDGSYSYYGNDRERDPHFTVSPTGGGNGEFTKFHITVGSFNAHVWFENGYPAPDEPWRNDGGFGTNLPDSEREEFEEYVRDEWEGIKSAGQQFYEACTGNPRPPRRVYRRR